MLVNLRDPDGFTAGGAPWPLELTKLKGKAIHVHISDCDGNLPPGRGVIKFEPYLQAIKELDINCTVSVEL